MRAMYRRYRGLYRSRCGMVAGVCKGIAEYFDFRVFWIRLILMILILTTGIFPFLVLYFVAALLMKPAPAYRY
ncbi:MAG: PspC domain-containing protein [Desulfobacteraceae bacterium]|nr:PspC domain-containing protein [Desulfobacteraceae bacterium]